MPVQYVEYRGKKILHVDLRDMKDKDPIFKTLDEMRDAYLASTGGILLLLDVTNTYTNPEIMDRLKMYGKQYFKGKSAKRAVVGVTGMKKILMSGYNLFTNTEVQPCDSIEEAKAYLVR